MSHPHPELPTGEQRCAKAIVETVCHDMNNYLTAIDHNARLVQRQLPAETPHAEGLTKLLEASSLAQSFIQRLQRFSRYGVAHSEPIDAAQWITDRWPSFAQIIPASTTAELDAPLPGALVPVDREALRTVLLELIANAIDALQESPGKICVQVRTYPVDTLPTGEVILPAKENALGYVDVSVADSGPGNRAPLVAPPQDLFLPCYSGKLRGRGLGLCSVFGMASTHEAGLIWGTSPLGGALIHLLLPIT